MERLHRRHHHQAFGMPKERARQNRPKDPPRGKDKDLQEKNTATGSTRARASTKVASSHIFAANATRKVTMP